MKLHLKTLCREFHRAEAKDTVPAKEVNPYLLKNVLWPTLQGNAPMLGKIDYDQFDDDDISKLCEYYEKIHDTALKLAQFSDAVMSVEPVPCRSRQFC